MSVDIAKSSKPGRPVVASPPPPDPDGAGSVRDGRAAPGDDVRLRLPVRVPAPGPLPGLSSSLLLLSVRGTLRAGGVAARAGVA